MGTIRQVYDICLLLLVEFIQKNIYFLVIVSITRSVNLLILYFVWGHTGYKEDYKVYKEFGYKDYAERQAHTVRM